MKNKNNKGFTLIELLIVVLLIGILSGILLGVINVGGIRSKSRDSQRIADLRRIQVALELYFADNRAYPIIMWGEAIDSSSVLGLALEGGGYINKIPLDPKLSASPRACTAGNYTYSYISNGSTYALMAIMEVSTSNDGFECTLFCSVENCYSIENP